VRYQKSSYGFESAFTFDFGNLSKQEIQLNYFRYPSCNSTISVSVKRGLRVFYPQNLG